MILTTDACVNGVEGLSRRVFIYESPSTRHLVGSGNSMWGGM